MTKTDKNVLKFIRIVRRYPSLWRKEDKDFTNNDVRKRLYRCLARESGFTEDFCRRKLKGIKDRMRETCHRLPRTKTGELASHLGDSVVTWPYFHHLLYMSDQFLPGSRDKWATTSTPTALTTGEEDREGEEELQEDVVVSEDDSPGGEGGGEDGSPETDSVISRGCREETTTVLIHPTTTTPATAYQSLLTPSPICHPSPAPVYPSLSVPPSSSSSTRGEKRSFREATVDDFHILKTESRADNNGYHQTQHTDPINHTNNTYDNETYDDYDRTSPGDIIFTPPPVSRHPGVDTDSLRHKAKDMWDAFAVDITNDLRLVTDPLLQIETKAKVRRIVEQAAQQQLAKIQRPPLSSSLQSHSHYHHHHQQPSPSCGDTTGLSTTIM